MRKYISLTMGNKQRMAVLGLFGFLITAILLYGFFVNEIVMDVVARRDMEKEILSLSSRIGELESRYIALARDIDMEFAESLGFREPSRVSYVERAPLAKGLTLNNVR